VRVSRPATSARRSPTTHRRTTSRLPPDQIQPITGAKPPRPQRLNAGPRHELAAVRSTASVGRSPVPPIAPVPRICPRSLATASQIRGIDFEIPRNTPTPAATEVHAIHPGVYAHVVEGQQRVLARNHSGGLQRPLEEGAAGGRNANPKIAQAVKIEVAPKSIAPPGAGRKPGSMPLPVSWRRPATASPSVMRPLPVTRPPNRQLDLPRSSSRSPQPRGASRAQPSGEPRR
jgi:hypothetical protein